MLQSNTAKGTNVAPTPAGAGEMVSYRAEIDLTAAQVVDDQIIEMGPLPANCDLVDVILDGDELDTNGAPTLTANVGVMSGDFGVNDGARTVGAELMAVLAATMGTANGFVQRPTTVGAFRIARSNVDRGIGIHFTAAAATAAAGKLGLTVIYRG